MDIGTGIALGGLAIAFAQLRGVRAVAEERKRVALGELRVRLKVLVRQLQSWVEYQGSADGETGFLGWYVDKVQRGALYEPHYNAAERRFHELTPLAAGLSITPASLVWEAFEAFLEVSDTVNERYTDALSSRPVDNDVRADLEDAGRRLSVIAGRLEDARQFELQGWKGFWKQLGVGS